MERTRIAEEQMLWQTQERFKGHEGLSNEEYQRRMVANIAPIVPAYLRLAQLLKFMDSEPTLSD